LSPGTLANCVCCTSIGLPSGKWHPICTCGTQLHSVQVHTDGPSHLPQTFHGLMPSHTMKSFFIPPSLSRTFAHVRTHTHTYTHTDIHTHTHSLSLSLSLSHASTHAYTHPHAQTQTRTPTHTHTTTKHTQGERERGESTSEGFNASLPCSPSGQSRDASFPCRAQIPEPYFKWLMSTIYTIITRCQPSHFSKDSRLCLDHLG
jgi:hypothetical protein